MLHQIFEGIFKRSFARQNTSRSPQKKAMESTWTHDWWGRQAGRTPGQALMLIALSRHGAKLGPVRIRLDDRAFFEMLQHAALI
jgi:hypothetical protein